MEPKLADLFSTPMTLDQYLLSVERNLLLDEIDRSQGNLARVARSFGLSYRAVRYRMQRLGEWQYRPLVRENDSAPTAWSKLRIHILDKYGRKCQCCGATPESGAVINVDHIKPRERYPHLALDPDNLQVLCADCNRGKGASETDYRPKG